MIVDDQLENAIRSLLDVRGDGASITTTDAARAVGGPRWRSLTIPAQRAAQRLTQSGEYEIAPALQPNKNPLVANRTPLRIRRTLR